MSMTIDRKGNICNDNLRQDHFLEFLYGHALTRILIRPMVTQTFSKIGGWLMTTRISAFFVPYFVRKNHIELSQYEAEKYQSFNDFFTRRVKKQYRPFAEEKSSFISPCDGRVTVCKITKDSSFYIKQTVYTLRGLLKSKNLAKKFEGGYAWILRLSVDDYHRYIYVDDGIKSNNYKIFGVFHTVNPVANDYYPIYKENTREYSLLKSENFGTVLMMEVGAMLVGKIENNDEAAKVHRGGEKGNFAFGGSTIILLTTKKRVVPDQDILSNSKKHIETKVLMGQQIGRKCR